MTTFDEIKNLSDEEVAELNNKLAKKLVKKFAVTLAVTAAVHIGVSIIAKKLESSDKNN